MELDLFEEVSTFLYGSVASLPSPSSNIEAWSYGTWLRFASLLHLGYYGYVNIADYVIIIILLTVILTHLFSRNLKFQPIGIKFLPTLHFVQESYKFVRESLSERSDIPMLRTFWSLSSLLFVIFSVRAFTILVYSPICFFISKNLCTILYLSCFLSRDLIVSS